MVGLRAGAASPRPLRGCAPAGCPGPSSRPCSSNVKPNLVAMTTRSRCPLERAAEQLLVRERAVDLGRVEERHAELDRAMDGGDRLALVALLGRAVGWLIPMQPSPSADTSSRSPSFRFCMSLPPLYPSQPGRRSVLRRSAGTLRPVRAPPSPAPPRRAGRPHRRWCRRPAARQPRRRSAAVAARTIVGVGVPGSAFASVRPRSRPRAGRRPAPPSARRSSSS